MGRAKHLAIVPVILSLTACVAVIGAAGAGGALGYRYVKGELQVEYKRDFDSVWMAVIKSVKDLKIQLEDKRHDEVEGCIKGKTALGKKVKIRVKYNGNITKVKIRVGTLGDIDYSLAIKHRIDAYLRGGESES